MILALILFVLFALMSAGGGYWIGARFRSRAMGALVAGLTLAFFVALAVAMWWMVEQAGAA
ncbi:MAG: hypothetical protein AAF604_02105 [Acidobacteriota bacterium]